MRTADSGGFTLIELVIALVLIAVGVIATAPLFVYASQENAGSGDLGSVGALAVQRLELLRATAYNSLDTGGSLATDLDGYSDGSSSGFVVRWTIADNPNPPAGTKLITVRALSRRRVVGRPKEVTLITVRGS